MKPVSPVLPNSPETLSLEVKIAESQDQYETLPALCVGQSSEHGDRYVGSLAHSTYTLSRWELSDEDIERIIRTRSLFLFVWNFGWPQAPVLLTTESPDEQTKEENAAVADQSAIAI